MGLQVSYTDKAGDVWEESYWVVSDFKLDKKFHSTPDPAIAIAPGGPSAPNWVTTPGYYARLVVQGWTTKASRDAGNNARFIQSVYPTDFTSPDNTYYEYTDSYDYRMEFDMDSSDNLITQAYNHILTLDIFDGATQV